MIDIGAKTAAFMPMQEVSINRVEGLSDVLQPGEIREFFIMSEVAYIRFASVYRQFRGIDDFVSTLETMSTDSKGHLAAVS